MTDRGPLLMLSEVKMHRQVIICIGIVSDQSSHVHLALGESQEDFEKDRLM